MSIRGESRVIPNVRAGVHSGPSHPPGLGDLREGGVAPCRAHAVDGSVDHVTVHAEGALVVAVPVVATESTSFAADVGVASERLQHTACLSGVVIDSAEQRDRALALGLFLAFRRHRMAGRTHYVFSPEGEGQLLERLLRPLPIRGAHGVAVPPV